MTVTNKTKPEVNLEEMEKARLEEAEEVAEEPETPEEPKAPKEPKVPEKEAVDWETKFKESQKEAMILSEQIKKAEEEKLKKIEITDEFLTKKYPDWEDLTIGEQKAIKKAEELEQEIQEIKNKTNQFNNDRAWQEKIETWVEEDMADMFPLIVGREEEFKRFATRPTRKGLPVDDLAKIFLFENPPSDKKKSLFHAPGSGNRPEPSEGMSVEEAEQMMRTRPLEYMRLVKSKKLKIKV